MEDEIARAYEEKLRRDALASSFSQEIGTPHNNPHRDHIDSEDLEALAMAIERSTPDQVARWIQTLLYYACADDQWDNDPWEHSPWNENEDEAQQ